MCHPPSPYCSADISQRHDETLLGHATIECKMNSIEIKLEVSRDRLVLASIRQNTYESGKDDTIVMKISMMVTENYPRLSNFQA